MYPFEQPTMTRAIVTPGAPASLPRSVRCNIGQAQILTTLRMRFSGLKSAGLRV